MGAGMFIFFIFYFFLNLLCASLSSRRHLLSLRTLGICRLVLLAGGVSIMSRLLCLKNVALAVSVSDLSLFSLVDTQDCGIRSHESFFFFFKGVKLVRASCPVSSLCCHACWVSVVRKRNPITSPLTQVLPPTSCKRLRICVTHVNWGGGSRRST